MSPFYKFHSPREESNHVLATKLASFLRKGDCLLLEGNLGTGKTAFARALINALEPLEPKREVPSPTYALVHSYEKDLGEIIHIDLYRLNQAEEIFELGFLEALPNALTLIEWPERMGVYTPEETLKIVITDQSKGRDFSFYGNTAWVERLSALNDETH